jgi:hypothetical protein
VLLVQNFPHGQQLDDPLRPLVERAALVLGVLAVAEGDEEAALASSLGLVPTGKMRPSRPMSPTCTLLGIPPSAIMTPSSID